MTILIGILIFFAGIFAGAFIFAWLLLQREDVLRMMYMEELYDILKDAGYKIVKR